MRAGILFDAAFEDTTMDPVMFQGDSAIFRQNLKNGGFFIVSGDQEQRDAEGMISDA